MMRDRLAGAASPRIPWLFRVERAQIQNRRPVKIAYDVADAFVAKLNHLADRSTDLAALAPGRCFFDEITNPADDPASSIAIFHDVVEDLSHFF